MKKAIKLSVIFVTILLLFFIACDDGINDYQIIEKEAGFGGTLVWIEGGTFKMGSPYAVGNNDEFPLRDVALDGFWMGKYQVTQEQYLAVTGTNPSYFDGSANREPFENEIQEKRPVEQVSWYDAIEFCNALSEKESLTPYYIIKKVFVAVDEPDDFEGTITLSFLNSLNYSIICKGPGGIEKSLNIRPGNTVAINLVEGEWNIIIKAFDADENRFGEAEIATVQINRDTSVNNFAINGFDAPENTGTFLWQIAIDKSANGYRLPTEAQWEYACRAGSQASRFYGGTDSDLINYAWYRVNSGNMTHQVGLKKPNNRGLYDIYGNVREWCWDLYNTSYNNAGGNIDPLGADSGSSRVFRGGAWNGGGLDLRSAYRSGFSPFLPPLRENDTQPDRYSVYGFRIVRP